MSKDYFSEFVVKSNKRHNNKYSYHKETYQNSKIKTLITCPVHGDFYQTPAAHVRGDECPMCANIKRGNNNRYSRKEIIDKFKTVHGDLYNYDKVKYKNIDNKIIITCSIHGDFKQTPIRHLQGQGCPRCSGKNFSKEEIISQFNLVHGDKYDYSKFEFNDKKKKSIIICPSHGEFKQTPYKHSIGQGCPICGNINRSKSKTLPQTTILKRMEEVHGNSYEYNNMHYKGMKYPVTITCRTHGDFTQYPEDHINGHGCWLCAIEKTKNKMKDLIINREKITNEKYDYSKSEYINNYTPIVITCPIHGDFKQTPDAHFNKLCGCPDCGRTKSEKEIEIYDYLCAKLGKDKIERRNRTILNGKEIDIYIPSLKTGIEYNGIIWHSTKFKNDKYYHINKTLEAQNKGIKLIQIFEDEYIDNKENVLDKLSYQLGLNKLLPKISGHKCIIDIIDNNVASTFYYLKSNNIVEYNSKDNNICLSAIYNDNIIAIMTFSLINKQLKKYSITNIATDKDYIIEGIESKLFKYFISKYKPSQIIADVDVRWYNGDLFNILGFIYNKTIKPNFKYVINSFPKRFNDKLAISDNKKTYKIYDCGYYRYIWIKQNNS